MAKKAQAITELAVFGAIILFLLGVLLTYGLRQNYHQQVNQHAFRKAMSKSFARMGGASYTLIHDRHIPDPQDTHGVGSITSVSATAYVTRDYLMGARDDIQESDLPRAYIGIGGGLPYREHSFYASGLQRYEWTTPCLRYAVRKYEEIFGQGSVDDHGKVSDNPPTWAVTVVDSCEGELISYEGCKRTCRQFTDLNYCIDQCNLGKLTGVNCFNICNTDVPIPAYCGVIDSLFSFAKTDDMRYMGVQPDTFHRDYRNDTMTKRENPGGIRTTDQVRSGREMFRWIIYKPYGTLSWAEIEDAGWTGIDVDIDMQENWP